MVDRDESALHQIKLSIEGRAMLDRDDLVVADIRDADRMEEVFGHHRPHVVFHTAALKHLSLLEMYPEEAVKSNVWGTHNVLTAAASAGVERFVNVSTDKAADPTSVLGYTKRLAEGLTSACDELPGDYVSVRFGNVLGSRGSVLTAFRTQIDLGGPVTVTDPDVTRYFMLIEEAVQLVIQAGVLDVPAGAAMVLDMGEPVSIQAMAEALTAETDQDIEIVHTGLRPGEKRHETLIGNDEQGLSTAHDFISMVRVPSVDPDHLRTRLAGRTDLHCVLAAECAELAGRLDRAGNGL
jgi:FlaA1/EpsC-like NDP-sugar epimerase